MIKTINGKQGNKEASANGELLRGFNAKDWVRSQTVTIPLIELLALSPDYNKETKEAFGYAAKSITNINLMDRGSSEQKQREILLLLLRKGK